MTVRILLAAFATCAALFVLYAGFVLVCSLLIGDSEPQPWSDDKPQPILSPEKDQLL